MARPLVELSGRADALAASNVRSHQGTVPNTLVPRATSVWVMRMVHCLADATPVVIIQVSADRTILAVKAFRKSDTQESGPFILQAIRNAGIEPTSVRSFGLTKRQRAHILQRTGLKVAQFRTARCRWHKIPGAEGFTSLDLVEAACMASA